ncbi:MAG: hypothetical protein R3D51_14255 [Hyphomicrobiaceae bacterium]
MDIALADVSKLLIAPHHGRDSGGDREYLRILRPKLTLFGCAPSEHLAYDAWSNRSLAKITNKQAGNVVVDMSEDRPWVYVQDREFAAANNSDSFYSPRHDAYCWGCVI